MKQVSNQSVKALTETLYAQSSVSTVSGKVDVLRIFLTYLREKEIPVYMPPRVIVNDFMFRLNPFAMPLIWQLTG